MITGVEYGRVNSLRGLSSDTKPTDVPNGSRFYEIDTGDTYIFDAEGVEWYKMPSSGGGPTPPGPTPTPGEVTRSDVNFYDYDGTLLHSYTKEEAQTLTALPENPSHTGLVAQGWNYTLEGMKAQLSDPGKCDIGQMYITESGDTEIDISITHSERRSLTLSICVNGEVNVDWGDNTTADTVTGSSLTTDIGPSHTYASTGDYTITIHVVSGVFSFNGDFGSGVEHYLLRKGDSSSSSYSIIYSGYVNNIRLGSGITEIGDKAFYHCSNLENVTLPNTITEIGSSAFGQCERLKFITVPNGITAITEYMFSGCFKINNISIPRSVTSIGKNSFYCCYNNKNIVIPNSVTIIGDNAFESGFTLEKIIVPSGVTSIGTSVFSKCYSIESIDIPSGVTSIGNYAFQYCYQLENINIPNSVQSIGGSAFSGCYHLRNIIIPDVITEISNSAFLNCYNLSTITIPSSVVSIGTKSFGSCYGLKEIHFLRSTPPTVGASNAFNGIPTDCIIYVPTGKLSAYTTATNYPSSSTYTYVEE